MVSGSCKKDELPSSPGTPVFHFQGTIDGSDVSLTAGDNSYYLYSDGMAGDSAIYKYISTLKPTNCDSCPNSIKFILRDTTQRLSGNFVPASSIFNNYHPSLSVDSNFVSTPDSIILNLTDQSGPGIPDSSDWFVNGTLQGSGPQFNYLLQNSGHYKIFHIISTGACSDSISQSFDYTAGTLPCIAQIQALNSPAGITLTAVPGAGMTPPYTYQWFNPDSGIVVSTSDSLFIDSTFQYAVTRVYATVSGGNGCSQTAVYNFQDISLSCNANFDMSATLIPGTTTGGTSLPLGLLTVEWRDENGVLWSSALGPQPNGNALISDVEPYDKNENGRSTTKMDLEVTCRLYHGNSYLLLQNGKATIAVANP